MKALILTLSALIIGGLGPVPSPQPLPCQKPTFNARVEDVDYKKDVDFALDELEKRCGHFFKLKEIEWKKVRKEFSKRGQKRWKTDADHLMLLIRLLARLEDGHARVEFGLRQSRLPGARGNVSRRTLGRA